MYLVGNSESKAIESVEELSLGFQQACKPAAEWKAGTEFEMLGVHLAGSQARALDYEGEHGVLQIFEGMAKACGGELVRDNDKVIALVLGESQVTFEPGGQLEFAGPPVQGTAEFETSVRRFFEEVAKLSIPRDLTWMGLGFRPFGTLDEVPWMPKTRYRFMREFLSKTGTLAHEMMKRTATVQVNLDYSDEHDAQEKLRASVQCTSLLTALYANSPIVNGKESGYQSYRSHIWSDTDPDRCGLLPFALTQHDDIFRAYVEWALDVPMFFVFRGDYRDVGGISFRQFLKQGFEGEVATVEDWGLHLSTLFPEVRLKPFVEIRGCDNGSYEFLLALAPLCEGLLYDRDARAAVMKLCGSWSLEQRVQLAKDVAQDSIRASIGGRSVRELCKELLDIAKDGITRVRPDDGSRLDCLFEVVESGVTPADQVLEYWRSTGGDPAKLASKFCYPGLCLGS